MNRFKDFTTENFKQLLDTIDINVLYSKITELSVSSFFMFYHFYKYFCVLNRFTFCESVAIFLKLWEIQISSFVVYWTTISHRYVTLSKFFFLFQKLVWDKSQISVIAETAFLKYGADVKDWTSQNLKDLGKFLSGLPTELFSKISEKNFKERYFIFQTKF